MLFASFHFTFVLLLYLLEVGVSCFTCHLLRNFFFFKFVITTGFVDVTNSELEEILEARVLEKTKHATSGWMSGSIKLTSSKKATVFGGM